MLSVSDLVSLFDKITNAPKVTLPLLEKGPSEDELRDEYIAIQQILNSRPRVNETKIVRDRNPLKCAFCREPLREHKCKIIKKLRKLHLIAPEPLPRGTIEVKGQSMKEMIRCIQNDNKRRIIEKKLYKTSDGIEPTYEPLPPKKKKQKVQRQVFTV